MFLWQKLNYEYKQVITEQDFEELREQCEAQKPEISTFDTETTGLNFMKDLPFLFAFAFLDKSDNDIRGYVYIIILTDDNQWMIKELYSLMERITYNFAHNTKYDNNMMINADLPIPDSVKLADGMTVARLTEFADAKSSISLETLGTKYVDENAKFASKAIKEIINKLNKERLKHMKTILKKELPKEIKMMSVIDSWRKRVQFIDNEYQEYFHIIEDNYTEPNYYDVYLSNPELMMYYAADDVVILLEYLMKALPVLKKTSGFGNVFEQECELIKATTYMERNGLRADVDYLLSSRIKVKEYIDDRYKELYYLTNTSFTSGQHKIIMQIMKNDYNINMINCDVQALQSIVDNNSHPLKAKEVAELIIELRTLDKWLSTYIEGMLNRVYNGRIYSSINNSGAVTGRVSSDLQQQPKEPLIDKYGNELFHPRRAIINDEGYKTYYFDFSQMELRLQANYTVEISSGDYNLCRAFIPFKCNSVFTGEQYNLEKDYENWNTGEWVNETGNEWTPTDLHTVTTLKAFPHVKETDDNFQHFRKLGKMANFLKNYGGGIGALKSSLKVDDEIANALNRGYYQAFPKVLDYQKQIEDELTAYGYIENIYGRRYYIQNKNNFYLGYNYRIQGGCADLMKDKQIQLWKLMTKNNIKSKMSYPVHDEIMFSIRYDEEYLIDKILEIMNDNRQKVKYIPMICDVEVTYSSWADKENLK